MLQGHIQDLSILVLVEEAAVLIDDVYSSLRLVGGLSLLLRGLLECMLHEAGEHLGQLHL